MLIALHTLDMGTDVRRPGDLVPELVSAPSLQALIQHRRVVQIEPGVTLDQLDRLTRHTIEQRIPQERLIALGLKAPTMAPTEEQLAAAVAVDESMAAAAPVPSDEALAVGTGAESSKQSQTRGGRRGGR